MFPRFEPLTSNLFCLSLHDLSVERTPTVPQDAGNSPGHVVPNDMISEQCMIPGQCRCVAIQCHRQRRQPLLRGLGASRLPHASRVGLCACADGGLIASILTMRTPMLILMVIVSTMITRTIMNITCLKLNIMTSITVILTTMVNATPDSADRPVPHSISHEPVTTISSSHYACYFQEGSIHGRGTPGAVRGSLCTDVAHQGA